MLLDVCVSFRASSVSQAIVRPESKLMPLGTSFAYRTRLLLRPVVMISAFLRLFYLGTAFVGLPLAHARSVNRVPRDSTPDHTSVLILGGGVAGVIAARTLYEQGITNFTIIEARGLSRVLCA